LWKGRHPIAVVIATPFVSVVALTAVWQTSAGARSAATVLMRPQEAVPLASVFPITRRIATGEVHRYGFELAAGRYVSLAIEQQGIDLGAELRAPQGRTLVDHQFRQPGTVVLSGITHTAGTYVLEIRALENTSLTGHYTVLQRTLRRSDPSAQAAVAAERVTSRADEFRSSRELNRTKEALRLYPRACRAWKAAGDSSRQASCLRSMGETHRSIGETDAALRSFDEALSVARGAGDGSEECAALNASARVLVELGNTQESEARAGRAMDISRTLANDACRAEALNALGDVAMFTGRERDAVEEYAQALAIFRELLDRRGQARSLLNLGYIRADLSDVAEAESKYREALVLWRELQDPFGQATTLTGLGHLHYVIGERQEALDYYRQASKLFERIGDRTDTASMLNGMGMVHLYLGEPGIAQGYFQQAAELFRLTKFANGEAASRLLVGASLAALGRFVEAFAQYSLALAITRNTSDVRLEGRLLEYMGSAKAALGELDAARQYLEESRSRVEALNDMLAQASALNSLGALLDRQGRPAEALQQFEQGARAAVAAHGRFEESLALFGMARVKAGIGQIDPAVSDLRRSLALVEALRGDVASLDLRASYVASVRDRYDLEVDLLMRLHERQPDDGYDAQALEASERARARSLLDGLAEARAGIRHGADPALLDRERTLRHLLNAKALRLSRTPQDATHDKELTALNTEVDGLTAEYRDLEGQIRASSPVYAALTQPQPVTLHDVQQLASEGDSVLLEYFLGSERSYVWAATARGVAVGTLPSRAVIEGEVRPYVGALERREQTAPEGDPERVKWLQERGARVSSMLLAPIAASLERARVIVVADGILQMLPFAALPDPRSLDGPGGKPLIAEHEVIHLPSASTLALLQGDGRQQARWAKSVMVFADPVFERDDPRIATAPARVPQRASAERAVHRGVLDAGEDGASTVPEPGDTTRQADAFGGNIPRLLGSRREARAIAALSPSVDVTLDFAVTRDAVMNPQLANYRIIHFATHGIVDQVRPGLSGIILSLYDERGRGTPGFLRLHDIYNLNLPVDLVVLSACSTGVGKEIVGEGLIGLVRGFMYAGSRRVLATLWKVDDEASSELMTRFYRGVLQRGLGPAAALREAQLEMSRDPRWADPFYWAPFVLDGDWR